MSCFHSPLAPFHESIFSLITKHFASQFGLRWLNNSGMFDNSFLQICPGKHFKILVRIYLNYKHLVLYSTFESLSGRSSVGFIAASRAEDPSSNPSRRSHAYIFFLIGFLVYYVHAFFPFYPIVLYYYNYKISSFIGLRYSTILSHWCTAHIVWYVNDFLDTSSQMW